MRSISWTLCLFAWGFILVSQPSTVKAQAAIQGQGVALTAVGAKTPAPTPSATPPPIEYLLNSGDVLDVYIYDVPELSHVYTVSPSGAVTMPLLPAPVQAAGLTAEQFARALEDAFRQSGRLQRPEIAVSVKQSVASSVAVEGAVKNPLIISEMGRTRLMDVITQCGGLADDVGATVTITRGALALRDLSSAGGAPEPTVTVDLKKVMDVGDPVSTTAVWPGDRVSVARALPDLYYVLGEVKSPGGYTLKKGQAELTVLRALALAGDATSVAKISKTVIIRKDPEAPAGREEIKVDLKSVLLGKAPDPKLQADDILFVPGSNSKKALHTLEAAPSLVAGGAGAAIIYH